MEPAQSVQPIVFITTSYVLGSLSAIVCKMAFGSAKHLVGRSFRLRMLISPVVSAVFLSFPLVFIILPRFGPPSGRWGNDWFYAFLTTYATVDMTSDFFKVHDSVRRSIRRRLLTEERLRRRQEREERQRKVLNKLN